jgi:hypothetical protein
MNKVRKFIVTIPFCFALATPVMAPIALAAPIQDRDDHDRDDRAHHRYYDADHRDYHEWNGAEQRYWRNYWVYERRPYIDWDRASDEQRRAYWHWRHEREEHHDRDDRR